MEAPTPRAGVLQPLSHQAAVLAPGVWVWTGCLRRKAGHGSVPASELKGSALGLLFQEQDMAVESSFIYLNN